MAGNGKIDAARLTSGLIAVFLSLWFGFQWNGNPALLLASLFFLVISVTDTLFAKIHNLSVVGLLVAGSVLNFHQTGVSGLVDAGLGLIVGICLLLGPYLFGGMGAGDVKALGALGALIGPEPVFQVFLYTALFGGILGIVHYVLNCSLRDKATAGIGAIKTFVLTHDIGDLKPGERQEKLRFPYAAAIAYGFFAYVHWGDLLAWN